MSSGISQKYGISYLSKTVARTGAQLSPWRNTTEISPYLKFGICDEDFVKFYVCRVDKKNRDMQRNWHYQGNDGVIDDNKLSAVFEDVLDYVEDVVKELIK